MVTTAAIPQPIPVPADFPVTWEQPDDERLFWNLDRMHFPDLLTPMDFALLRAAHEQLNWAFAHYGIPLSYSTRYVNYRWYLSVNPTVSDLSLMPSLMQAGLERLSATISRLETIWNVEWLPEVRDHLATWDAFDLAGATMEELLVHFDETLARHNRVWQIHFLQTFPVYMAMSMFEDLYQDLFGVEQGLNAYVLMQGLPNKTVEMGRALWQLSRTVLASPVLRNAFDTSDPLRTLAQAAEGQAFLIEFDAFLNEWGRRGEQLGVSYVSWREDPSQAIAHIRDYVNQPEFDFDAQQAALAAEREEAIAIARARLAGYPRTVIEQYESMLYHAQVATVISEDHNYYIDFVAMDHVRQVVLELGRRFARAGVIAAPQDIFLLTPDELRETAARLHEIDRKVLVARRTAEMDRERQVAPPQSLGTLPAGPHPDDPLTRALDKFFGLPAGAPEQDDQTLVIHGNPGSSGKLQGIARVILTLDDAGRLAKGDILVAPTTAPAWTPLFATAAAIVTDTGGVLSHSAVVAREYRIPAVVGTGIATTVIPDGDLIEVDGDRGTVRIVRGA